MLGYRRRARLALTNSNARGSGLARPQKLFWNGYRHFLCLSSAPFLLDKIEPGIYLMKKTKVSEKLKARSPQVCETNSLKTEGIYFSIIAVGKADLPILCDM